MKKITKTSTHELLERLANLDALISRAKWGYSANSPWFDLFLFEKNLHILQNEREAIKSLLQKKVS